MATKTRASKILKKTVQINTEKTWRQNGTLPDPILDWERFTLLWAPSDITALVHVDEDENSDDDEGNFPFNQLLEEFFEANLIKGFAEIQETAEDIWRVSQVVWNGLLNKECTLGGEDYLLETKLQLIIAE